jgi:histidinol-phosphatase (PHP family)
MKASYHTHTYLCGHAQGRVSDYLMEAQKAGADALGFSDHCPFPEDGRDNWSDIRMPYSLAPMYCKDVRERANEVSFPVYLGFECEWDSEYSDWYTKILLGELGADYLVLGSHWLTTKNDSQLHKYVPTITEKSEFHDYITQTIEAVESGIFTFIAHPDLPMAHGLEWDDYVAKEFERLIDSCVKNKLPMEVNGLGMNKPMVKKADGTMRYQYPVDEFWKMAKEKQAIIICNSDAHSPDAVIAFAEDARHYANIMQLNVTELSIK